jgi:hypothetical protein
LIVFASANAEGAKATTAANPIALAVVMIDWVIVLLATLCITFLFIS